MTDPRFERIVEIGQSIWYDNISRELLQDGTIQRLVEAGEIRGITSNPAIFEKSIAGGSAYDEAIAAALQAEPGLEAMPLYERLAIADIQAAADALRPIFDASEGADGFISLEVSPRLAHDTEATIAEARRLHTAVDRPNLMIKVPATDAGLPAIRTLIAAGIHVNVTLIFSHQDWQRSAQAYVEGLQQRRAAGQPVDRVASVASFFVSRLDSMLDKQLADGSALRGKVAVAYAKLGYAAYRDFYAGADFAELRAAGARPQRLLFASTGTKNPTYSDLLYVEDLIGPDTVNTMPPATLDALRDHGQVADRIGLDLDAARQVMADLAAVGIDIEVATRQLKDEGVASFMKCFDGLLDVLEKRRT